MNLTARRPSTIYRLRQPPYARLGRYWIVLGLKSGTVVIWAIKSLRGYLWGTSFAFIDNHKALENIGKVGNHIDVKVQRWRASPCSSAVVQGWHAAVDKAQYRHAGGGGQPRPWSGRVRVEGADSSSPFSGAGQRRLRGCRDETHGGREEPRAPGLTLPQQPRGARVIRALLSMLSREPLRVQPLGLRTLLPLSPRKLPRLPSRGPTPPPRWATRAFRPPKRQQLRPLGATKIQKHGAF